MRFKLIKTSIWVLVLAVLPLLAADFWETKEYTAWSEKECMNLLRKSPWAFSNSFRTSANLGSTETGVRETTEIIEFRLLTAKPIRMALGRLQLLNNPNDEALKEQVSNYVTSPPGDEILVQISYRVIPAGGYMQDLHGFFGRATLATFVDNTFLITSDGEQVSMANYLPWNSQRPNAIFVFPRLAKDGEPYFTEKEKSITLRSEFKLSADISEAARSDRWDSETAALARAEQVGESKKKYKIHVKMKPKEMVFRGEFAL